VIRALYLGIPALIAIAAAAVVSVPSWREAVQRHLSHTDREVLATAEGDLLGDGSLAKVIKYRGHEGIFVEILKVNEKGETQPIDRLLLPDKQDGLFNYQGHVTRLAIADIDGDGKLELLAPSFDNQLVPHLNVFRYNPSSGRFELVHPTK
jgi:hypothetical protein